MTVALNGVDLVALSDYKEYMEITSTTNDAKLSSLVSSISQLVKTYCSNSFLDYFNNDRVETISIHDNNICELILSESPVVSVISVEEREATNAAYEVLTANEDYSIDADTDTIYRVSGGTIYKYFPTGPDAVRVTYRAGYSAIPADLKLAVFDLITYYYKEEYKPRQSLAGGSINNASSVKLGPSFPDHIKRILDLYKNIM